MSKEKIAVIKRILIEEAQSDVVGLWAILWEVKSELPSLRPEEARAVTLEIIRAALTAEELAIGEFGGYDQETTAFSPWQTSVRDALERIEREWIALGREPSLGEIAWFVAPRLLPLSMRLPPGASEKSGK